MARKRTQINKWVIHTERYPFRLLINELDEEYVAVKQSAKDGTLVPSLHCPKPYAAADSLDWTPERIEKMTLHETDEEGRFVLDTEEEAKAVIKELNKCFGGHAKVCTTKEEYNEWRGIKFHLDPNSPPLTEDKGKKK